MNDSPLDDDEAVALECDDGVGFELRRGTWRCRHETQHRGAALSKGALEARLPPRGLVPGSARRTRVRQRARRAARDPRETDGRAEIHECLRRRAGERVPRAALDALDVDVSRQDVLAEGEVPERGRRVRPDAGELRQLGRPAVRADEGRGAVQRECASVVAEPLPFDDHVGG